MKQVLTITSDDSLVEGLEAAANLDGVAFRETPDWSEASERLVEATFEAVCIDYEAIAAEGLDAFVQLDNILQKEETEALLLLREASEQARQFGETLDSLVATINLREDPASRFRKALETILDQRDDPDDASGGASTDSDALQIELPDIEGGSLDDVSVARLVHAIARREATGLLELWTGHMDRRFAFRDGQLAAPVDINTSSTKNLEAAFAWSGGTYAFAPKESIGGETSDPYTILLRGALNHLDQRGAMGALTAEMSRHVAATNLWEARPDSLEGFDDLETFVEACDGETTLEQILSSVASRALKGFQAAFFAVECDLVALTDEPTTSPVTVEFAGEGAISGGSGTEADTPSQGGGAEVEEPSTAEREQQLREQHAQIEDADPYEVLGLWEGCGEDAVRSRYFELVKTHHPDAHGGNISEEAKRMAEEIFIAIKEAHSELLRREDEQTIPPSAATETDSEAADGLSGSLASPSVTAMGSGQLDDEDSGAEPTADSSPASADAGAETSEASHAETSRESGSPSGIPDDPQATMPPGAGDSDATSVEVQTDQSSARPGPGGDDDPDATIPPGGPSNSGTATPLGGRNSSEASEQDDEDRREKLEQLRQRASSTPSPGAGASANDGGSRGDTGVRKNKLDGLRKSSTSQAQDRVDNLQAAETADEAQEYFNRGYKAYKNENNEQALECFEKAHEFDEDNGLYKTFYGYLQFLNDPDKKDEAQQLLREALKSDNRQAQPDAHLFYGRILKVKDEHERARKHFERSVDLNPESIEAKRELRVYEMREDKGKSPTGEDQNAGDKIKNLLDKDLF
jgi:hypothetical protein